jgi:hypothetical protein
MNKTIYMTYKKNVPDKVPSRWKKLNPNYNIDFSLDADCIDFLRNNFNDYIVNMFQSIKRGMYKADLWRLCKLYIHGGVYADIDLVPHIDIDSLDKDITFYSCLSACPRSIFQAFMVNFSKPKNPLILHFLLSFLLNKPYTYENGPTFDMYNCLKYNLNGEDIKSEIKYNINEVKINVVIGSSKTNTKRINLFYFPKEVRYNIRLVMKNNPHPDSFYFKLIDNFLYVKRADQNIGWDHSHSVDICIKSNEAFYMFQEKLQDSNYYVSNKSCKILDSRDVDYDRDIGWTKKIRRIQNK